MNESKDIKRVAVLLTVFNRREVTLTGLRSLYRAIDTLGEGYAFDVYMTDDGSKDGTKEAVEKEFPNVIVTLGDGNLYWGGGMRKAWQRAIESGVTYDYFLWFNDDAELYEDALKTLFKPISQYKNCIVSGAFCDHNGDVSYGGRDKKCEMISPIYSLYQPIVFMNGNLVLIDKFNFQKLGMIDSHYIHGLGDWDYGLRAREINVDVVLTDKYVGIANRHDGDLMVWSLKCSVVMKLKKMHTPKYSPFIIYYFNKKHFGFWYAIKEFLKNYIYTICPFLLKK
jgi:GT2 family glycosyltransferase